MPSPMNVHKIAQLNAEYRRALDDENNTHMATHQVARDAGLVVIRVDDESGVLYADSEGHRVYGWSSGGFDNQID